MTEQAKTEPPKSGLVRRIGPAILMSIFALAVTISGGWFFAFAAALCGVLMVMEWQTMTGVSRNSATGILQSSSIIVAVGLSVVGPYSASLAVLGLGALAAGAVAKIHGTKLWHGIFGVLYLGVPMLGAMWLRNAPGDMSGGVAHVGLFNILWVFAVVWAGDTGAYAFGRIIGGAKLAPAISPNKTWAGSLGGAFLSILAGLSMAYLAADMTEIQPPVIWLVALVSLGVGVVAQLGDLFESSLKRSLGVKDSGTLIPGHGGALDRLDSFLFAVVLGVALIMIFGGDGHVWIG